MFWKLFGSEKKVQEALEQSTGQDISPKGRPPVTATRTRPVADEDVRALRRVDTRAPAPAQKLELWLDYAPAMAANAQPKADAMGHDYEAPWEVNKKLEKEA